MQQHVPWLVAGRYEVGDVVGRGGYGMVYRGLDRQTGQRVALKMLSPEAGRDADVVERMLREQQALVALSGTCAVTAIDLCRLDSSAPCLVMEWLEGCDLEQQLGAWEAAGERGSVELLLAILAPLTQTLERAHGIGIVHRDIKPANIFLTPGIAPGVRLLDFGLSRMKSAAPLTAVGMVMGSPSYIAPETWRGNSAEIDGRADLFSLGVIVFRWLTGKLPFDAPDLVGKMLAVTTGPRPSAVSLNPSLPRAVDAWVARALAIDPQARFQSGHELRDALLAALHGSALPTPKPAAVAKPRALADAQQAFAAAFRSAAGLLKRFTAPVPQKTEAPAAKPTPEPVTTNRNTLWLDSSELQPVAGKRNTLWLDSNELEPIAAKRNTLWLDSSELEPVTGKPPEAAAPAPVAAKRNTLWLDSSELTEVAPSATPPEAEPTPAKGRVKARANKAKPLKNTKARVTQRKQRKGPFRKSSR
ncbi:MAG TPA: serine/threonine-protein kinase [Polyangiaceae bacterium]|nr:serine/threonine-protein kinase [Polyangiaceae bacterium]